VLKLRKVIHKSSDLSFCKKNKLKANGHPWEMAKAFDTSCPVSEFIPASSIVDPHKLQLICKVNGKIRQVIWSNL